MCVGESTLLTAGRSIKLWDISTQALIKVSYCEHFNFNFIQFQRFTGHANNVMSLFFVTKNQFMSAADNDRNIGLW